MIRMAFWIQVTRGWSGIWGSLTGFGGIAKISLRLMHYIQYRHYQLQLSVVKISTTILSAVLTFGMGALLQREKQTLPEFLHWCNTGDLQKVTNALESDNVAEEVNLLNTGLILAVMKKQNAVAELLLNQPNTNVNFEDNNKSTALHWACYVDNTWALDQLLATPTLACFNNLNSGGDSPLMVAVGSGSMACAKRLLAREEVDLDVKNRRGMGVEERAREMGYKELLIFLREAKIAKEENEAEEIEKELEIETSENARSFSPTAPLLASNQCPVCFEDLQDLPPGINVLATPCGHLFCSNCLNQHLENSNACPTCRKSLQGDQSLQIFL